MMVVFSGTSVLLVVLTVLSSPHLQVQSSQDHRLNDVLMSKIANFSADPCEDFYEYACGNFINVFANPWPNLTWTIMRVAEVDIWIKLDELLSEEKIEDSYAVNIARQYYHQCRYVNWTDQTTLLQVIKEFQHWPIFSYNKNWTYGRHFSGFWNFEDFMQKALKYQAYPFFQISIEKYIPAKIQISKPIFKESQYQNFKDSVIDTLQKLEYAQRKFDYVVMNENIRSRIRETLHIKMEITLKFQNSSMANLTMSYLRLAQKTLEKIQLFYVSVQVKELSRDEEKIVNDMWKMEQELRELDQTNSLLVEYFEDMDALNITWPCDMQRLLTRHLNGTWPDQLMILYDYQTYFPNLINVLKKYTKRAVASYIVWTVVHSLTTKMVNTPYKKEGQLDWNDKDEHTKKENCLVEVKDRFPFAAMRMYADRYINSTNREAISKIANDIKLETLEHKLHFFDDESWRNAKAKINKTDIITLYPDFILDDKQLDEFYNRYDGGYLSMNIHHARMLTHLQRKELHDTYDQKYFPIKPLLTNAFYHLTLNRLYIEASLESLFPSPAPPEMQYGNIGMIIGHEFAHSFLLEGFKINENGVYGPWMTEAASNNFKNDTKCYIDFYSNMTMFGLKIDGERVISETMSDGVGLYVAYKALERVLGGQLDNKTSANLNLTKAQTFFLSYAQNNCAVFYEETSRNIFKSSHPFINIRIKGTLQNNQEFAKAFNCKVGSTYNPENKCLLY